jgi:UDP-glucuronate decarboxylase
LKGQPITIHGDGSQTRSFCYTGPLNLGNPAEITVRDLANSSLR